MCACVNIKMHTQTHVFTREPQRQILNTHHHHDHSGGNAAIKKLTGCKVIGPRGEQDKIPAIDEVRANRRAACKPSCCVQTVGLRANRRAACKPSCCVQTVVLRANRRAACKPSGCVQTGVLQTPMRMCALPRLSMCMCLYACVCARVYETEWQVFHRPRVNSTLG